MISKTHCRRDHELTPENTYIYPSTGYRKCRACERLRCRKRPSPEKQREYRQRARTKNPERSREYRRRWRANNPEKVKDDNQKWKATNPEKVREYGLRKRARKLSALGLWWQFIPQIIPQMLRALARSCSYCHKPFGDSGYHIEHMTPLSRGGSHGFDNITLACPPCNRRKGTKTREEYLDER